MRSRNYYKTQTRFARLLGAKPCDGKMVHEDPQIIVDIFDNARLMDDKVRQWDLESGINWLLGLDAYVKDKNGTLSPRFAESHIFKRGHIILAEFFGNFGTELTYEHPAIVLADTYDGVIIAPISSRCYNDGINTHVSLEKSVGDLGNVKNNCGIKLEQSRFISKRRILKEFGRVTNTIKLNEIDSVLMKMLTPISYNLITAQQGKLLEELSNKNAKIEERENEIEALNRKIETLEQQLLDLQSNKSAS